MSKIARKPITIRKGVEFSVVDSEIRVKGKHGSLVLPLHSAVNIEITNDQVRVLAKNRSHPMVGTTFKLVKNMIHGVCESFERKLQLVGVGYRAKVQGDELELSLGFSNPVLFEIPKGVTVIVPTPAEIILQGVDNQLLGEVAGKICDLRPTEPYKGKGIRPFGKKVVLKQTKKKK
jgi:large subunit ribosomal protein L6